MLLNYIVHGTVAAKVPHDCCGKCGTCEDCTGDPDCEHTYGGWTVKTAATCITAGTEEQLCTKCPQKETRDIAINTNGIGWQGRSAGVRLRLAREIGR